MTTNSTRSKLAEQKMPEIDETKENDGEVFFSSTDWVLNADFETRWGFQVEEIFLGCACGATRGPRFELGPRDRGRNLSA